MDLSSISLNFFYSDQYTPTPSFSGFWENSSIQPSSSVIWSWAVSIVQIQTICCFCLFQWCFIFLFIEPIFSCLFLRLLSINSQITHSAGPVNTPLGGVSICCTWLFPFYAIDFPEIFSVSWWGHHIHIGHSLWMRVRWYQLYCVDRTHFLEQFSRWYGG